MIQPLHGVNPSQNSSRLPTMLGVAKWATIASILCATGAAEAKIVYVNSAIATSGNGSTWSTSYKYLQDALASTTAGDAIYIARGTYYPDKGAKVKFGDRQESFVLSGQLLYGGFSGTEANLSQRNPKANVTKLSGAIWDRPNEDVYWSLHVVVVDQNSTLDGLTVSDGNANGASIWNFPPIQEFDEGGGCYVKSNKILTLNECIFRGNRALQYGGAIAVQDTTGKVLATNCGFENNKVGRNANVTPTKAAGGAIRGNIDATNCNFSANSVEVVNAIDGTVSEARGGAINGTVTAVNCTFTSNYARAFGFIGEKGTDVNPIAIGGAIAGNLTALRCDFVSNESYAPPGYPKPDSPPNTDPVIIREGISFGGATGDGSANLANCTFSQNKCSFGRISTEKKFTGGGGAVAITTGKSSIVNCIFNKNSSQFRGGAILSETSSFADSTAISNSTFLDNEIPNTIYGTNVACGGIVRILNNIFWDTALPPAIPTISYTICVFRDGALRNSAENYPTPVNVALNLVKGGPDAIGRTPGGNIFLGPEDITVIRTDPRFVNISDLDGADNTWGTADDGLRLSSTSSAIGINRDSRVITSANFLPTDSLDADLDGDVTEVVPLDFSGYVRFQGGYLDMGAYEFGGAIDSAEFSISEVAGRELTDGVSFPFGTLKKGKIGKKTFVIKNLGTNRLTKISYTLQGSKQITLRKSYLSRLDPGASVAFTVVYRPTSKGKQTAALRITSSDADESVFNINFSGTSKVAPRKRKARAQMITAASNGTVEVSSDLLNWSSGAQHTTTLVDGPAVLTFRDDTPLEPGETR